MSERWLKAWFRAEWPGLSELEATLERTYRRESMTRADCKNEREREEAFAREFEARLKMTPEELATSRRAAIAALAVPENHDPPKWDPYASAGKNIAAMKAYERRFHPWH